MPDLITILQAAKADWGRETVEAIKLKIQRDGVVFSSDLLNSIAFTQDNSLDGNILFSMKDYGKFIDEGVNGRQSAFTTPYQFSGKPEKIRGMGGALKNWADAKGLNAWAVANTLQKFGLKPRRFFKDVIATRLPDFETNLIAAYNEYLTSQINRQQNP